MIQTPEEAMSPGQKAARKMMALVATLHERGFEGLRLLAGLAPSGCYWRGGICASRTPHENTGYYSTGSGARVLFNWQGVKDTSLDLLADRFIAEFPQVARAAYHKDAAYVAWYQDMLKRTSPNGIIYFSADFELPTSGVAVLGCPPDVEVPAPPPISEQ